jgi:hypothetical protein
MAQPSGRKPPVLFGSYPFENFLESLLDFFGVKPFLA